ncbi:MAG: hypothetical protein PHD32_08100, partial [Eubacteriales bacterium]|nr:hypothetical protein [Eubacteriales bacterium]
MRKKGWVRFLAALCCAGLLLTLLPALLTGCAKNGTSAQTTAAPTQHSNETLIGRITGIEGETVTVVLGATAQGGAMPNGQPPSKPEGSAAPDMGNGQPPSKPAGSAAPDVGDGQPPALPDGETPQEGMGGFPETGESLTVTLARDTTVTAQGVENGTVDDLAVGDLVAVTFDAQGAVTAVAVQQMQAMPGGENGGQTTVSNGTAAATLSQDDSIRGQTYTSTGDDENALRVDGATGTLDGVTV